MDESKSNEELGSAPKRSPEDLMSEIQKKRAVAKLSPADRFMHKARDRGWTKERIEQDVKELEGTVHLKPLAPGTEALHDRVEALFTAYLEMTRPGHSEAYLPSNHDIKGKKVLKQLSEGE